MRIAALALLLTTPPASWAYVPCYQLLQQSKLVVAGEVVEIRTNANDRLVARLKIAHVYKGDPGAEEIDVPFKMETTWACDFTITYAKGKKYVLLLDDKHDFRVVYYPSWTHQEIDGYQSGYARWIELAADILDGVRLETRVAELVKLVEEKNWKTEAIQLFRIVPRSAARPHLAVMRRARPRSSWGDNVVPGHKEWGNYCTYGLAPDLQVTRDLSMISHLLEAEPDNRVCPIEGTLSLLTGWTVVDLEGFKISWARAIRRAGAHGTKAEVPDLVKQLSSNDPEARDRAFNGILDLGPDVLESVKEHSTIEDIEARARVRALIRELELLQDLRLDVAPRSR